MTIKEQDDNDKEEYECECIECGKKVTSEKHCKDYKCPECGGDMRRVERPGPGQPSKEPEEKLSIRERIRQNVDKETKPYEKIAERIRRARI